MAAAAATSQAGLATRKPERRDGPVRVEALRLTRPEDGQGRRVGARRTTRTRSEGSPPPPPQGPGTQHYTMDDECVPELGGRRPDPVQDPGPLVEGSGRHCGSGFELVLDATVPQLGKVVEAPFDLRKAYDLVAVWTVEQANVQETPEVQVARDQGRQGIAREIPEVQVPPRVAPRRVQQRTVRSEFQNEFWSRSLMPKDRMVFLRNAFRNEL